ncbi:MAG: hypothetical protein Q4B92_00795 [Ruminococcus sp.]|nr:hypothetical protein [Ruminococcus sp.]
MIFKRALSLVLVLILILTCQCIPVFAAEQTAEETVLLGSFNNWEGTVLELVEDNIFSTTVELEAGNYLFKIKCGDTEYGHPGTIKDTTEYVSTSGFKLSDSINAKCTLVATGGSYTFNFNKETHKLAVIKDNEYVADNKSDTLKLNYGGGSLTAQIGDTVTYNVFLNADKPFEDIQTILSYNSSKLNLEKSVSSDLEAAKSCPNISDAIYNSEHEGAVAANASNVNGYDFTAEKLLLTLDFTVVEGGETSLEFIVQEMTAIDGITYFAYSNKVCEGVELREAVEVIPAPQKPATVAGHSISLGGNIAVSFYMELSDEVVADADAKVVFTLPTKAKKTVYVKDAPISDKGYYVFTCEVAAKEMASDISAQVITSKEKSDVFKYSVKEYGELILSDSEAYAKEVPVIKAMLNYGASAQTYFGYNTENLANESLSDGDKVLGNADFTAYQPKLTGKEAGVSYYGSRLSLKSETAIKHYFYIEDEENVPEFKVNGAEVSAQKKNGYYEIKISDIIAQCLDSSFVVTAGEFSLEYSVLSYGYLAMQGSDTNLTNVVKALYAYNQAADTYVQTIN